MAGAVMDWLYERWAGKSASQIEAESAAADARLKELNDARLASGFWSQEQYLQAEVNRMASGLYPVAEVKQAFGEGWAEGAAKVQGTIRTVIDAPLKWTLGAIPGWVWVAAAVAVFIWAGGGAWLARRPWLKKGGP